MNLQARSLFTAGLLTFALWLSPTAAEAAKEKQPPIKMDDPVVLSLGVRLRCPVCQGMPIGESPAPMAQDMMREVRRMRLEEGQSESAIAKHFTDRYGTWVLLDPPTTGFALLVWLLPPAVLMIGVGAALGGVAHRRAVAKSALGGQRQPGSQGSDGARASASGEKAPPDTSIDALLEQVRKQVRS